MAVKIIGTGSYIPEVIVTNKEFAQHVFLQENGNNIAMDNETIARKFKAITGIDERRYAANDQNTSDLAFYAAETAIADSGIDPETLDYIIVAHNFGDVQHKKIQSDTVPSIAARVKHKLQIKNPRCVAYDLLFGCPGWVEGMIQANAFINAGIAKRCLIIGAETLSRVVDMHDRDSMIYADGSGAVVIDNLPDEKGGILSHNSASFTYEEANFLFFGKSYNTDHCESTRYIKMFGRKIYEFALTNVPIAMKECFDKSGHDIKDLKKIIIHQANEKMDEAIVQRFYELYNTTMPELIMPMSIQFLGNSSVATIPTLFDLILKNQKEEHNFTKGDVILFASVGAGMNVNAITYQI
ncbi:ketoacyl-ACP synthase III [Flavobacterium agricola]|uniref:Ketoacyl-ACP synthase III n=1 Tax=Flavobacterium agricola TaxID=2870839 RepID=A0ABY6LVM3_9FLAO|nr:ketoacyl-ACP synthase III [Flavobacterium agricola]UYW00379.1 ketoacyl-ACP synthase III [Flavobacterium agricola]